MTFFSIFQTYLFILAKEVLFEICSTIFIIQHSGCTFYLDIYEILRTFFFFSRNGFQTNISNFLEIYGHSNIFSLTNYEKEVVDKYFLWKDGVEGRNFMEIYER